MTRKFEKTFSVAVPVDAAWQAFIDPATLQQWYASEVEAFEAEPGGRVAYREGGERVEGSVEEVEPQRRLRWSEGPGLLPGATEVTVVFEAVETGTRITVTHAGFGDGEDWAGALEGHAAGWSQILADLALLLEQGVRGGRFRFDGPRLGIVPEEVTAGVRVAAVAPHSFAAAVGLEQGDLLLTLNVAGVFRTDELWFFTREHHPGDRVEVSWVRDGQVHEGAAALTAR